MLGANFHEVHSSIGVLLVECKGCGKRAAIGKEDSRRKIFQGNMEEVRDAKFRCRKCGGRDVRAYIPLTRDKVDMFLAGDPVGTMKQAN